MKLIEDAIVKCANKFKSHERDLTMKNPSFYTIHLFMYQMFVEFQYYLRICNLLFVICNLLPKSLHFNFDLIAVSSQV